MNIQNLFTLTFLYCSQKAKAAKQSTAVLADAKPPSRWNLPDTNKKTSKPEIDYFDFSSN